MATARPATHAESPPAPPRGRVAVLFVAVAAIAATALLTPAAAQADFGFLPGAEGFSVAATAEGGAADLQAGSHPWELSTSVALTLEEGPPEPGGPYTDGDLKDLQIEEPPGLIENPAAVAQCDLTQFHTPRVSPFEESRSGESCPDKSQIGTVTLRTSLGGGETRSFGVFNLAPPPGAPSQLGFNAYGTPVVLTPRIRQAEGEYGVTLELEDLSQRFDLYSITLTIWGAPWALTHNTERGDCLNEADPEDPWAKCSVGRPGVNPVEAYLTLPPSCTGPLTTTAVADSWQDPGTYLPSGEPDLSNPVWKRAISTGDQGLQDCEKLHFNPEASGRLTTARASSPSGFDLGFTVRDEGLVNPKLTAPSPLQEAVLALPEGITVNPSLAAGLGDCTPDRYAAETVSSAPGAGCPNDSKIGDIDVQTPLFSEPLEGSIYLAAPHENPFGSLIALYVVAKDPERGILVKVAGKVEANPSTGQLTATFDRLPQLPYSSLDVLFREGQRAPLLTPFACGGYSTAIELHPWLEPESALEESSPFAITEGIEGGACPAGQTTPFAPSAQAGSLNSQAGAYSPFYLHLARRDTEQEITSYSAVLPPGLTGRLAGVPFCPEADIEAAKHLSGTEEEEHPSCPAASQIGRTSAGYGVGAVLAYAPGRMYLAGPYGGQPLSVVAIDSAKVGPFDLGTVVIRSAFRVDPRTAQLSIDSAASDPIPHILDGIPLHLRDIRVYIDRPGFTLNPTSCEPSAVTSTLSGSAAPFTDPRDIFATAAVRYQASNCAALGFAPKLALRLRGASGRGGYPALRAVVGARGGDANLARVAVAMPRSEFLAQNHIRGVCTRAQFDAGGGEGEGCPAESVYGRAVAYTPLFEAPLRGLVYLRSNGGERRLPDLVVSLSEGAIRIVLEGHIGSERGGIQAVFEGLPDAPLQRFVLRMDGGRRGLLVNSTDLCATRPKASARLIAQSNATEALHPPLRATCGKRLKRHRHHHRRRHR